MPRGQAPEPLFQTVPVHCSQWHYPAFFAESPAFTVHLLTVLRGGGWGHHAPKRWALIYKLIWLKSVKQTARIILWATIRWTVQALCLYIFSGICWYVEFVFRIFWFVELYFRLCRSIWHHHWIPGGQFTYVAYALRDGVHCFGYALGNVEYRRGYINCPAIQLADTSNWILVLIWHADARSNSHSIVFYPSCSTLNLIAH